MKVNFRVAVLANHLALFNLVQHPLARVSAVDHFRYSHRLIILMVKVKTVVSVFSAAFAAHHLLEFNDPFP
jgi:hypothetical protein